MKYLHYFLVAVMVTLVSKDSFSATEVVDGIAWTYTISDGQATIGEGNWVPAIDYNVVGKISVPSELGECPVVSIGSCAFSWCEKITSVTIPSSVVSIGPDAFYSCSKLVEVSIPASVTNIGEYAFGNCESLKSLAIPNGLVSIGNYAFRACTALKSVSLPISVNRIGYSAFVECDSISSISVPECVLQSTTPTVFPSSYSIITNVVICDGTK